MYPKSLKFLHTGCRPSAITALCACAAIIFLVIGIAITHQRPKASLTKLSAQEGPQVPHAASPSPLARDIVSRRRIPERRAPERRIAPARNPQCNCESDSQPRLVEKALRRATQRVIPLIELAVAFLGRETLIADQALASLERQFLSRGVDRVRAGLVSSIYLRSRMVAGARKSILRLRSMFSSMFKAP